MAEPGTQAPDFPAIFDKHRRFEETLNSRFKGIEQSLADLLATFQASEPTSSERRTGRSSARRKARPPPARSRADDIISLLNKTSKAFAALTNETRKDFAALTNETREKVNTLAKGIHTSSQVSQGPQARAEQGASTHQHREAESEDQALGNAHCDNSATSIKASRDVSSDSSSKDAPMRDYDEAQPSPSGSTATIAATASASQSAPRQATVADSRPDLCASSDHQHGAPAINPTPDSQSDGSIDQNPTTPGEQEREPGGRDSDTLMTDAEQPTCGRQDLAKRAAGTTAVTLPQAHEGEGGPRPIVANDQPAKSPGPEGGPEDGTDRLVSMEAFRSLINFEYLGDCDEFSRQLLPLLIQMADENIRGMKEDLARLMTGLATLDGLLGDPGLLQQSNTQNAASHRTALPGGTIGANGDHGKDNGIATGQIDFAYHAAIEDVVTPQLLQPVSGRDHEPEVDSERALEVSEAPKGKRKRFVEVVKHSKKPRAEQARKPLDELDLEDGNPAFRSIAQRGRQLSYSQERTTFERIFTRYDQLQYARGYQALKDDIGYDKLPPYIVAKVYRMNRSNHYFESICAVSIAWFEAVDQGKQFKPSDDVDWDSLEEGDVLGALERLTAITEA
ncbi:hypothetical protein CDV31_017033 [Fusarium ambrosium]|uniref:Uncharacterized protein n=1 Tax=Fusarium ambrosium TaxID=131363 RepID=A0A428RV75_9HYPO|nr:hypothetical protein CDV31_017033 [Fusarium ambrosium]